MWFFSFKINLLVLVCCASFAHSQFIVNLPDGTVKGGEMKTPNNRTFHAFQGIPFASPPIGHLRFQAPTAPQKWEGILDTSQKDTKICYQAGINETGETEDCLHLSVFTPVLNNKAEAKLPVLVWLFGGGFSHGNIRYDGQGEYLIEEDIIVVTLNYRVGPWGFLSTGDSVIPGNAGLKDQLMALKWVQNNIHLFGGDPKAVTILGVSAGGASTGYHIISKQSSGLFRAGIAQSGSPLNIWAFMKDPKSYAYDLAHSVAGLNVSNYDSRGLAEYLTNATAEEIKAATWKIAQVSALPVIEVPSEDAFITESMYEQLQSGNFNRVPLLIGTVSEERVSIAKDLNKLKSSLDLIKRDKSRLVPQDLTVKSNFSKEQVGAEIYRLYFDDVPKDEELGHLVRYHSLNQFSRALIKHAELQSQYTPVYFYQFSYFGEMGSPSSNISVKGADRISHGGEKYYIIRVKNFDKFSESDRLTHNRMVKMWSNFIKYQNPTPEKIELLQNIVWPLVTTEKFMYINIDQNLTIMESPKKQYYSAWKHIFEKYAVKPFITY